MLCNVHSSTPLSTPYLSSWFILYAARYFILRCNPISETDLAAYMLNCVEDQSKWNKILNIGGPDEGMTMKQQGEMIFDVCALCTSDINSSTNSFILYVIL